MSHLTLRLDAGAVLLAAEPPADLGTGYDAPEPGGVLEQYSDFGHVHWRNSLIWGEGLENIAIVGHGRIFGRGLSKGKGLRDLLPEERRPGATEPAFAPAQSRAPVVPGPFNYPNDRDTLPAGVGNKAIALKHCRNVTFRDFTIHHGGHFGILATGLDNLTIDNLTIDTNRDGIDIDACRNVRISNCAVNSPYDDAIVLKSSYVLGELRATENVTIVNCQVSGYDEGTLLDGTRRRAARDGPTGDGPVGRIKLGTESNGGFKNIVIANCTFDYCRGLALMSVDGGALEDVSITNLTMRDVINAPVFVRLGHRGRGPAGRDANKLPLGPVGSIRRLRISGIEATVAKPMQGILVEGLATHPIEDLTISDVRIRYPGGGTAAQAARKVDDLAQVYPEPGRWRILPSWAFWARHVRGLTLRNLDFAVATTDLRPALMLEAIADAELDGIRFPRAPGVVGLRLVNSAQIATHRVSGVSAVEPAPEPRTADF